MISVKDLRIGNLIYNHSEIHTVGIWHFKILNSIQQNYFKPIPLTEEWLFKFGFSNGNNEISNCDLWDKHWIGDFELYRFNDVFEYECKIGVKYVHQLQNLYFALTGKELTI